MLGALLQLEIGVDVVRLRPDIVRRTGILIFFESQGIEIILMMVWNIVIPCLRQSVLSPSATAKLQKVAASLSDCASRPTYTQGGTPSANSAVGSTVNLPMVTERAWLRMARVNALCMI